MERNKLVLDLNKNKEFNYIYKLTEEQIFSKLVNLEQLTFEVTDACNLNCKYCGYGSLYSTHEKRENTFMDIWSVHLGITSPRKIIFGFYGGEPLLNMPLIK